MFYSYRFNFPALVIAIYIFISILIIVCYYESYIDSYLLYLKSKYLKCMKKLTGIGKILFNIGILFIAIPCIVSGILIFIIDIMQYIIHKFILKE